MIDEGREAAIRDLVIGVTGHRHLRQSELTALRERVRVFLLDLRMRHPDLSPVVMSSLAQGSDQLVAEVAFDLGMRVIAPLPFPPELYRRDFADADALALFERQLARAETIHMPLHNGAGIGEIIEPGGARDRQYALAGIFIARHSHILLALWDGQDSPLPGGTASVIRFHLHGELPAELERRRSRRRLPGLNEDALVFHLPAGREGDQSESTPVGRWLASGPGTESAQAKSAFEEMFRRQGEFVRDARRHVRAVAAAGEDVNSDAACRVLPAFKAADGLARLYRRRVIGSLRAIYLMAALMGCAFIVYSDVSAQDFMIYLFLLFFLAGVGVSLVAKRRHWHRKYIDYRALAESLRVQLYWRRAGIDARADALAFDHDDFLQKQDGELGWIRNVMRSASLESRLAPAPDADAGVDAVVREWIGDPGSCGQLRYYTATAGQRARHHQLSERLRSACLWLGFLVCIILAILAHRIGGFLQTALVVAMGVLSVTAAVHEAYSFKKADQELIRQYRFLAGLFRAARGELDADKSVPDKRQTLHLLGEAALAEHAAWALMHRSRPLEPSRF